MLQELATKEHNLGRRTENRMSIGSFMSEQIS